MKTIRICNLAAEHIPAGERRQLAYMWEDTNIDRFIKARRGVEFFERWAPGQFVLVETFSVRFATCEHRYECSYYDPAYYLFLVPVAVWERVRSEVYRAERRWKNTAGRCKYETVKEAVRA